MLQTKYVTDHEKQIVKAKRGLLGYLKVILGFWLISVLFNALFAFVPFAGLYLNECLENGINTEEECLANANAVRRGSNLVSVFGAATIVSLKLNRDSRRRYENEYGDGSNQPAS